MRWLPISVLSLLLLAAHFSPAAAEEKFRPPADDMPGLIAFWDFQQPAGQRFTAKGMGVFPLREMEGPIERVEDGVFGKQAAKIRSGQWMRIPRDQLGPLDIHGPKAQVTLVAWIKRDAKNFWQSIAGVWDETHKKRQYMLFLNARARTNHQTMERDNCQDLIHGHVSSVGGPTPGYTVCRTYSSGTTPIPMDQWTMIAMTYDGKHSRVYVNGKLDAEENYNPFPYDKGLFDGGNDGADFTVGANHVAGLQNNNRFGGLIGGLAVFDRALSEEELLEFVAE